MEKNALKKAEEILRALSALGFRRARMREALVSLLSFSSTPISVAQMLDELGASGRRPNKTTVYRELEFLKRMGYVKELTLRNDVALYELSGPHHHHFVCMECGMVRDIEVKDESISCEERRLEREEGFRVLDHSLEFFGHCWNCR